MSGRLALRDALDGHAQRHHERSRSVRRATVSKTHPLTVEVHGYDYPLTHDDDFELSQWMTFYQRFVGLKRDDLVLMHQELHNWLLIDVVSDSPITTDSASGGLAVGGRPGTGVQGPQGETDPQGPPGTAPGGEWVINVVTDHGAAGDGVADDTSAIQAALDDGAASGRRVYFPPGVYITTRSLHLGSGTYLFGVHPAHSIIRLRGASPVNVDMIVALDDSGQDITLENLTVDGNLTAQNPALQTTCLHLLNVANLKLIDCNITGSLIDGVYVYKCTDPRIIRVNASDNGLPRADASGINLDTCTGALVQGCVTRRNGFHGINLANTSDSVIESHWTSDNGWDGSRVDWSSQRNRFDKFNSQRNFRGIYFLNDSTLNHIERSILVDNQTTGIYFANSYANVASFNHIENCGEYAVATVNGNEWNYGWGNTYRGNGLGNVNLVPGSSFDPAQGTGFAT